MDIHIPEALSGINHIETKANTRILHHEQGIPYSMIKRFTLMEV